MGNFRETATQTVHWPAMSMAQTLYVTNTMLVEEDEVTYGWGGDGANGPAATASAWS